MKSATAPIRIASFLAICALPLACGDEGDDRPPASASEEDLDLSNIEQYETDDSRNVFARGSCSSGTTQVCRVYLPSHNDIQPCFVGEQECLDGAWGECGDAVLVDANAGDRPLDPADPS